jgi:hypothetical protein
MTKRLRRVRIAIADEHARVFHRAMSARAPTRTLVADAKRQSP